MAAEAEGIVEGGLDLHGARGVGHVIQVALGVRHFVIDGGRDDAGLDRLDAGNHFDRARRAQHVAGGALDGADGEAARVVAKEGLDGPGFGDVALGGGGAVGVDVGDGLEVEAAAAHGDFHAAGGALAVRAGGGDVVGVGGVAVAGDFAVDAGAPFFGVLQFFEHEHARALAHDEAVAFPVKRARGAGGVVVAGAERLHGAEAADADGDDGGLGAAGEHDLRVAHLDGAPGFAQGVVGGGAGRAGGEVGPPQLVVHREDARGHVDDEHGDHEGREPARAALAQNLALFRDGLQSADPGADEHAHFIAVDPLEVQARVAQGLPGGVQAKLGEAVGAPDFLGGGQGGAGVECLHLAGDLRIEPGGVEAGDAADAAPAGQQVLPKLVHLVAQRGHGPQPGDDDAAFGPITAHKNQTGQPSLMPVRATPELFTVELLLLQVFDVFDDVADALQLFGLLVGNLAAEFLFERHDQFHRIEGIRAEVFNEFGLGRDLARIHPQLLDNDVFDSLFNRLICHVFLQFFVLQCVYVKVQRASSPKRK